MEKDIAIKVEGVSKIFRIPHQKYNSLKEQIVNFWKPKTYDEYHALDDISFQIHEGDFFGIVGRNGSGKSTLLKMIAGIYVPDKGKIEVEGRISPFIELGVGFNPDLTARENIYLNGTLLGLTRKEITQKFDEIVDFAEIRYFLDQKLRNFSSGMQVRLAFSIGIQAHSEILLLDEVLAVGDAKFQEKCFKIFDEIKGKKTVIFVSHDLSKVERFCTRAVLIDKSKKIMEGSPKECVKKYLELIG